MEIRKVRSLTPEQWEHLRAVRDEHIAASRCTDPADRPAAQAAISRQYELAGHELPQFIWCESPAAARLVIWLLSASAGPWLPAGPGRLLTRLLSSARATSLVYQVEESCQRSLDGSLGRQLLGALRALFGAPVAGPLEWRLADALQDLLQEPFPDVLRGPLGDSVRRSLPGPGWPWSVGPRPSGDVSLDTLWDHRGGQHETSIVLYEVPRRLGIVSYRERDNEWLDLSCTLARSCGWWWPYQHVCIVAERPAMVRTETPGGAWVQLHCPDGPAVLFRDGWSVHAWHGTRVPATLVENGWDVAAILAEPNVEIRRCAIEKLGWDEFERHLIAVASAPDPGNPGQLLTLYDVPAGLRDNYRGAVRLLLCSNGTPEPDGAGRRFGLTVPPHHTDPVAAAAESYGWSREEYASLARRA